LIVEIESGRYRGLDGDVDRFLGIAFAAPTVGPLRWTVTSEERSKPEAK
jgi:carboxylesterase type B